MSVSSRMVGVEVSDLGAAQVDRWIGMSVLQTPHQSVASITTAEMTPTSYQDMVWIWGEETAMMVAFSCMSKLFDRARRLEIHPFDRVLQQFGLPCPVFLPPVTPIYRTI